MEDIFAIFFCAVSLIAIIITVSDKKRAQKGKRRIRERTLFIIAAFGGAFAMYATMLLIRHKTLHKRFMLGLPAITAIQILLLIKLFE